MLSCHVNRKDLIKALDVTRKVIDRSKQLPILSNVLLQHDGYALTLTCSDLESYCSRTLAVDGDAGQTTVGCKTLTDVLKRFSDDSLTLQDRGREGVQVVGERATITVKNLPADEYPTVMMGDRPELGRVAYGASLRDALQRTLQSVYPDDPYNSKVLQGVLFEAAGNVLTLVGCNTHTCSVAEVPYLGADFRQIVPTRVARLLAGVLSDGCDIGYSDGWLTFATAAGTDVVRCQAIDGEFPRWQRIVPASFDHEVQLQGLDLRESLKIVSGVDIKVQIDFSPGRVTLTAKDIELGEARAVIEADVDFEDHVRVDGQRLMSGLFDDGEVTLCCNGPRKPIMVRGGYNFVLAALEMK